MAQLWLTFIDVGWGDSILLELEDGGSHRFALIDSNDTTHWPNSYTFLKRHLERYASKHGLSTLPYPLFDLVVASHAHADHIAGLKTIIKQYGTDRFYFPRFNQGKSAAFASLVNWAGVYLHNNVPVTNQRHYLAFPNTFTFGCVQGSVLWPPAPPAGAPNSPHDYNNENNNSLVLAFKLNDVFFVTTGDCEAENWRKIPGGTWQVPLPAHRLKLIQIPHHGAHNGLFDSHMGVPLLDQIRDLQIADPSVAPLLAASCHPVPHSHPDPAVVTLLDSLNFGGRFTGCVPGLNWLRTDENLHFTIWTDGSAVETRSRPPF